MDNHLKRFVDARMMDRHIPSQRDLAHRIGANENYLSNVLSGRRAMGAKLRLQLSEALGVNQQELLNPPGAVNESAAADWQRVGPFLRERRNQWGLSREDIVSLAGNTFTTTYLGLLEEGLGTGYKEFQDGLARALRFRGSTEMLLTGRVPLPGYMDDPSQDSDFEMNPTLQSLDLEWEAWEPEDGWSQLSPESIRFVTERMAALGLDIQTMCEKSPHHLRPHIVENALAGGDIDDRSLTWLAVAIGATYEKTNDPSHWTDIPIIKWADYGLEDAPRELASVHDRAMPPNAFAVALSVNQGIEELIIIDPDSDYGPGDRIFQYVGGIGPSIARVRERYGQLLVQTEKADGFDWQEMAWVRPFPERTVGKIVGTATHQVRTLLHGITIRPEIPVQEYTTWTEYHGIHARNNINEAIDDLKSIDLRSNFAPIPNAVYDAELLNALQHLLEADLILAKLLEAEREANKPSPQ